MAKAIVSPATEGKPMQPLDSSTDESAMSDKDKRRVKAQAAWEKLQAAKVEGLVLPASLGGRISFTVKDPAGQGSSIGVILSSESFYISKAAPVEKWPTTCTHLKASVAS